MIALKEVKHYPETNSVEATWVDRIQLPDVEVPASEAVLDEEGRIITPAVEAHTVPGEVKEITVKCHSYADVQMDMLRADLGADAAEYETLIATVEAGIVPPSPPTYEERIAATKAERAAAVEQITVTTASGKTFDGDETSQGRMARAVTALDPGQTTLWILADNTPDLAVTREELREALRLAGQAQTAVWIAPYQP